MTDRELLQQALDALEAWDARGRLRIIEAIGTRLAQPEKEWVGLTDKEMFDCLVQTDYAAVRLPLGLKLFAEFIEAKLKEKNT
jgi:hypothetical protein